MTLCIQLLVFKYLHVIKLIITKTYSNTLKFENRKQQRATCVFQVSLCRAVVQLCNPLKYLLYSFRPFYPKCILNLYATKFYLQYRALSLMTNRDWLFLSCFRPLPIVSIHKSLGPLHLNLYLDVHCALLCFKLLPSTLHIICDLNTSFLLHIIHCCYCIAYLSCILIFFINIFIEKRRNL